MEALRDEFAGFALMGVVAAGHVHINSDAAKVAKLAYCYADAMLFERRINCPVCGRLQPPDYLHISGCTYGYQVEGDAPVGL